MDKKISMWFETNGKKDCKDVFAKISTGLPVDLPVLYFRWTESHAHSAIFLARHLQSNIEAAIHAAHRDAYEQGWKDAKRRNRKKTFFPCIFMDNKTPCE